MVVVVALGSIVSLPLVVRALLLMVVEVLVVVEDVVYGHSGHEAQNHWSHALRQSPPKVAHTST
jgi:hypothetical protein